MGPTYTPSAYSVECQVTKNWYVERVESGKGRSPFALLRSPGRAVFCDPGFGNATVRGIFTLNGHVYAVVGSKVIEIFANGTFTVFAGMVADDGLPVYMAANPTQLFIVSGKKGYILAGTLTQITDPGFPTGQAIGAGYVDGYFFTGIAGTQSFGISDINDGLTWNAAERSSAEQKPDFIFAIGAISNEIWPFGPQTIQVFNDTADFDFPFQPRLDVQIDNGIWAPASLTNVGGAWYFLAGNEQGFGMALRMQGYSPSRVSDFSFEYAVSKMPNSSDAIGMSYLEAGHLCWGILFPAANQFWVYDVSVDQWHQRTWTDPGPETENAYKAYCMTSAFGHILVGDRIDGKIYRQSISLLDDGGDLIRRVRRAPCIDDRLLGITHNNFVIDGNMGIGLDGVSDPDDPTYDPKMMLRFSNDGGEHWGNEHWRGFGRIGQTERRAIWRRLGYSRRRVYESVVTAPVDWAISGCYVNMREARS